MPQPYSAPQPNQTPYPTAGGYQAPYQPFVNIPTPMSVPANLEQSTNNQNSSTRSLNNVPFSGYNTIQPSHIRASLTSAIDDRLRQRLKELMGKLFEMYDLFLMFRHSVCWTPINWHQFARVARWKPETSRNDWEHGEGTETHERLESCLRGNPIK
jgi:hypothetical protein